MAPRFTKRHYTPIASSFSSVTYNLNKSPDSLSHQIALAALNKVADDLCNVFKNDNYKFDRQKFMDACWLEEQEEQ